MSTGSMLGTSSGDCGVGKNDLNKAISNKDVYLVYYRSIGDVKKKGFVGVNVMITEDPTFGRRMGSKKSSRCC